MLKEYKSISDVYGPLMIVEDVEGISFDELVEVQLQTGEKRLTSASSRRKSRSRTDLWWWFWY